MRRGDAVRLGRQHVRNGIAKLKTEKTGIEVTLPILPVLQCTLDAGPCGELTFIVGANGKPLNAMPSHYTREADRVRLAKEGIGKLVNERGSSIPSSEGEVREPEGKPKLNQCKNLMMVGPGGYAPTCSINGLRCQHGVIGPIEAKGNSGDCQLVDVAVADDLPTPIPTVIPIQKRADAVGEYRAGSDHRNLTGDCNG